MALPRGGCGLGQFVSGDVVVVRFPFADLRQVKRRPALVLAALPGDDLILCQITSQTRDGVSSVPLEESDFLSGSLQRSSRILPTKLFTTDSSIVAYRAGTVSPAKLSEARGKLIRFLTA